VFHVCAIVNQIVAPFQHWTTVVMALWIPLTQHTVPWPVFTVSRVTTPVSMLSLVLRTERGLVHSVWLLVSAVYSSFNLLLYFLKYNIFFHLMQYSIILIHTNTHSKPKHMFVLYMLETSFSVIVG